MRRTERLFQIIQILRRHRRPVTGRALAEELETSLRTVYRDMAELIAQRVPIRGEAGTGYVLDDGYDMPPLMLTPDEIEAAVLGARWVAARGDATLARGAQDLIAKLTVAIPKTLQPIVLDSGLQPVSFRTRAQETVDSAIVRDCIRNRAKLWIEYADEAGAVTTRTVWPILLGYADEIRLMAAWCELRDAYRSFRTDRIRTARKLDAKIPKSVAALRRGWEARLAADKRRREQAGGCP